MKPAPKADKSCAPRSLQSDVWNSAMTGMKEKQLQIKRKKSRHMKDVVKNSLYSHSRTTVWVSYLTSI